MRLKVQYLLGQRDREREAGEDVCGDEMEETPLEHQSPSSSLQEDEEETVSSISFYLPSYVPTSAPPPPP